MATEERGAMFDEFVQGGLIDDADVTLRNVQFELWDYRGKAPEVFALRVDLEDGDGAQHDEHLSAGDKNNFRPSSDGRKAMPIGSQQKLNVNTNAAAFIISIMNADTRGELAQKLKTTDDITILNGLKCHVVRKAQPKRAGIPVAPGREGIPEREKTQLQVERIIAYPWETAPATAAGTSTAAPAQAAAAPAAGNGAAGNGSAGPSSDTADKATALLFTILGEAGGAIKKSMVAGKVFTNDAMKTEAAPVRNAVLALVTKDDFLKSLASVGINFDAQSGNISIAS